MNTFNSHIKLAFKTAFYFAVAVLIISMFVIDFTSSIVLGEIVL